ncbi:MAG: NAD(P)-binding domain-containing protein [Bacteroidia bacterium]|nr:NAD(P)-binding domain-containing protein [Bacteroidia bacterium]
MFSLNSKIGIIGSGAMGSGIAQVAATAGHDVFIYDNNPASIEKAKNNLASSLLKLVEKQKLTKEKADSVLAKSNFISQLKDLSACDLVIEAIVENLEVKQKVFSELETLVSDNCILATNTSSLSIASIAAACKKPNRFLGIHFFNPATLMPLVEIIPGIATQDNLTSEIKKLIDSWGKTTVITKDTPGFIVNRVARPFYSESLRIYEEGIADLATIDWAMKEFGGFKMGPFELMDLIGHDVNYIVTETVWKQFYFDPRFKPALSQKRLLEAGFLGRKTGRGFYDYNSPLPEPRKDELLGKLICHRVLCMLINEAADALYYNIAGKEDIDLAMTKGVNYPKGLLKWADEIGIEKVLNTLQELYSLYQEDRYRPSVLLKHKVAQKQGFY